MDELAKWLDWKLQDLQSWRKDNDYLEGYSKGVKDALETVRDNFTKRGVKNG